MRDPETELMLRVAAGDDEAFETLVVRMLPRLEGYFRRLGADPSQAEDCAQEVLMKVYRARTRYQARARFTTYLFHVARNHWIDYYRHKRIQPRTVSIDGGPGEDEDGRRSELPARPTHEGIGRDLARVMREAVDELSPDQREVFLLARVETLRYQEISEILDIPVGTVKSRMHAAIRQLRSALSREGFEPT